MLPKLLTILGLVSGILGSQLMYLNTQKVSYRTFIYQKEERPILEARAKRKNDGSKLGMLSLLIGFVFQLIAIVLG